VNVGGNERTAEEIMLRTNCVKLQNISVSFYFSEISIPIAKKEIGGITFSTLLCLHVGFMAKYLISNNIIYF
jgi:hypothetical protein